MYSLDINLLDRPGYKPDKVTGAPSFACRNLSVFGASWAALTGSGRRWWLFTKPKWPVRAENCPSRGGLNRLGIQEQEIKNSGTDKSNSSGDPSASDGFNQIRPWSAILQDIRDRIPRTVQIENIKQTTAATPPTRSASSTCSPAKSANSNPVGGIESGIALV